jgi:uncharacterized cupin superfamily protein
LLIGGALIGLIGPQPAHSQQPPLQAGAEPKPAAARIHWRKPPSDAGGVLGAILNVGTLPERESQALALRLKQNAAELKGQLDAWERALLAVKAPADRQALLTNLALFDPLYDKDQLKADKAAAYLKRLASLDQPTIERWQRAFSLSATAAVWELIQVDSIFEGDTLRVAAVEESLKNAEKLVAEQKERVRLLDAKEEQERAAQEAQKKAEERARFEKIEQAKTRTWASADGNFRAEAKFISFISGTVTLEKKDGKRIQVPIDKLALEDQQFIREQKWKK